MATMTHGPSTDAPAGDARASGGIADRLFVPAFWGTSGDPTEVLLYCGGYLA
jgi:hypothetical protein